MSDWTLIEPESPVTVVRTFGGDPVTIERAVHDPRYNLWRQNTAFRANFVDVSGWHTCSYEEEGRLWCRGWVGSQVEALRTVNMLWVPESTSKCPRCATLMVYVVNAWICPRCPQP